MLQIGLVILDWAGTTVDYGCIAPLEVFRQCFEERGIRLALEEIRKPMGLGKKDHIRELLRTDEAAKQWQEIYGRRWTEQDVVEIYEIFEEKLSKVVAGYSQVMDGVTMTVKQLRDQGLKIGSTTGYTPEMMIPVTEAAGRGGYKPDYLVTPQDVGEGRPRPFMIYENMKRADVYPPVRVVKAGDTAADILEGKNAGVWTVGIVEGSSAAGISPKELKNMTKEQIEQHFLHARSIYQEAGADYVIDRITQLPDIIQLINDRLKEKE